jgi:D-beta-D-heptose 7-phosphate kinase/D-beta-D-heptose 1-phosphate adenosyltransferase
MSRSLGKITGKKSTALKIIERFPRSRILVLGDLMLDRYLWGSVERISPEAPVPVVHIEKETSSLGGAANVAANVSALGAAPILVGVIGDDQFALELKRNLKSKKLSVAGLVTDSHRPTTVKTRIVAHSQQVVRVDRENPAEIDPGLVEDIKQSRSVHRPDRRDYYFRLWKGGNHRRPARKVDSLGGCGRQIHRCRSQGTSFYEL